MIIEIDGAEIASWDVSHAVFAERMGRRAAGACAVVLEDQALALALKLSR